MRVDPARALPRHCLVDPIPEMELAATLLSRAADALLAGDDDLARELLHEADMPVLHARGHTIMNKMPVEFERARRLAGLVAPTSPRGRSSHRRPTPVEEDIIYKRDGYRCRYCGCKIVLKSTRSLLSGIFPDVVPWPSKDRGKHGAFYALNGCVDHIQPHSSGGDNSPENLVVACWPCNNGKEAYTLEELGLTDPRDREPIVDEWDGLSRIVGLRRQSIGRSVAPKSTGAKVPKNARRPKDASTNNDDDIRAQWFARLDKINLGTSARILTLLKNLEALGAWWTLNTTLLVYFRLNDVELAVLGIESDGNVEIPWAIGDQKSAYKVFAATLAEQIPGARLYATPKMWRVKGGRGRIQLDELLDGSAAVILAGERLLSGNDR